MIYAGCVGNSESAAPCLLEAPIDHMDGTYFVWEIYHNLTLQYDELCWKYTDHYRCCINLVFFCVFVYFCCFKSHERKKVNIVYLKYCKSKLSTTLILQNVCL